ncbi:hypothetical protein GCM10027440_49220 [Nocardiopsis coralliicola]
MNIGPSRTRLPGSGSRSAPGPGFPEGGRLCTGALVPVRPAGDAGTSPGGTAPRGRFRLLGVPAAGRQAAGTV